MWYFCGERKADLTGSEMEEKREMERENDRKFANGENMTGEITTEEDGHERQAEGNETRKAKRRYYVHNKPTEGDERVAERRISMKNKHHGEQTD